MPEYKCRHCSLRSDVFMSACPGCGRPALGLVYEGDENVVGTRRSRTLADVKAACDPRYLTGIEGFDRVLGGGFNVPSSVILAGGPGTGKSSLIIRMFVQLAERRIKYFTTEERLEQVRARAERFGFGDQLHRIPAQDTQDLNEIMEIVEEEDPRLLVVDSINRLRDPINDTRHKEGNLLGYMERLLKDQLDNRRVLVIVSHLNKEDEVTGLRELQHNVDAVLRITKPHGSPLRLLSCSEKNRHGSTEESASFMMTKTGMVEIIPEDADQVEERHGAERRVYDNAGTIDADVALRLKPLRGARKAPF